MDDRADRLRLLLALEISRVVRDLGERQELLVSIWSRHRRREAFLDTLFVRWRTVAVADLALLDPGALVAVESFYDEVDSLRLYLQYTEDMPMTLADALSSRLRRLRLRAAPALDALGGAPDRPQPLSVPALGLDAEGDS